jgi:tetratricopeptide (TPR) repeat protein
MRALRIVTVLACLLALTGHALAQERGRARIKGKVVDEQGTALSGATVRATLESLETPVETKTDNRGEFELRDLRAGAWEVTVSMEGRASVRETVNLEDRQRLEGVTVKLVKADPNAEIQAEFQKAGALLQQQKTVEARKIYEDLLAKYPSVHQLHQFIARTYAAEGQVDKAIEHLRTGVAADAANQDQNILLGELLIEKGEIVEGEKLLMAADMTKVKDSTPYLNLAIHKINGQKGEEAIELLNKLMTQFPSENNLYYYRGRAYVQTKKYPEAKADLEKFVAAAPPDAREMADAKKILEQLKDVK